MTKYSIVNLFYRIFTALIIVALILAMAPSQVVRAATVRYIKPTGLSSGTCDSWGNACGLQYALGIATSGDELRVMQGTYYPTSGSERNATFQLKTGVGVYGGFDGTEANRTDRNWAIHVTILSGDIGAVGNASDNSYHVVTGSLTDSTAVLDGFTVTGGKANSSPSYVDGGGMYNYGGSPSLTNVIFSSNSADNDGGGMYNYNSHPSLTQVTFSNNSATIRGGGMINFTSNPSLTDVAFTGNSSGDVGGGMFNSNSNPSLTGVTFTSNSALNGGGIYNINSTSLSLTNVTFENNSANNNGGGMYNQNSNPNLTNVEFSGNSATIGNGGGIYNYSGLPSFTQVTFENNSAGNFGGGIFMDNSSPSFTGGSFTGNTAASRGGGMYNSYNSSPSLTDVNFNNNSAIYRGGGMYNMDSTNPSLSNVTFKGNSAELGGGMYNATSSNPNLEDVTFTNNTARDGAGMYNYVNSSTLLDVTFNGNSATNVGGGMFNITNTLTSLVDVTFIGNSAVNRAGGMEILHSITAHLENVTFTDNTAGYGGGMESHSTDTGMVNVIFEGNSATYEGGGLYNHHCNPHLLNVWIMNNTANYGAGMYNGWSSNPHLEYVTFDSNSANNEGGGLFNTDTSSPLLEEVTFNNNSAIEKGGGMYNNTDSLPSLVNVVFYGNSTNYFGGGIYNKSSSPTLVNVTFNANTAVANGGAMYTVSKGITLSNPSISNSILWGNNPDQVSSDISSTLTINYSDVQGGCPAAGATCTSVINLDPLFLNPAGVDLRLTGSSPAIDAGDNTRVPSGILTDLLDNPRFVDIPGVPDTGSGTPPIVDMGAYEFGLTQPTANNDSYSTNENQPKVVDSPGVLSNDAPNSSVTANLSIGPAHGDLTFNTNGSFTYTPDADYDGTDTFTYQSDNGVLNSNVATVTITVIPINDTTTTVNCGSGTPVVTYGSSITCMATVTRANGSFTPSGTVSWITNSSGSFVTSPCTLSGSGASATCSVSYTPSARGSGSHLITAIYGGDIHFNGSTGTQTVTVNRRLASVTPNANSKTYGDSDPALTGTLTDFLPADNVTATYSRTSGETVSGSPYIINATLSPAGVLGNYTITYNTANFTINKKAASVTPNVNSKTYGNNDPALTGTLSGFLPADNVTATYSRMAGETVAGSPYTISATLAPAGVLGNYNITYNTANFTITKRSVTVTADAKTKSVGQPDPVFTYQITSGSLAFSDAFSGTLSRVAGENLGPYAILQGSLALNDNYTLTFIGANLTITNLLIYLPITLK